MTSFDLEILPLFSSPKYLHRKWKQTHLKGIDSVGSQALVSTYVDTQPACCKHTALCLLSIVDGTQKLCHSGSQLLVSMIVDQPRAARFTNRKVSGYLI